MIDIISFVNQHQMSISIIVCSLMGMSLLPLNLHIHSVKLTVPPPNLHFMGQTKQGLSVCWEAERQEETCWSAGSHPTETPPAVCEILHTQRKDAALLTSLLQSSTASHPDNMCLPASCLYPAHPLDDPNAFLWFYEGLAVACGQLKDEAGREQPSSDCIPQATMQS